MHTVYVRLLVLTLAAGITAHAADNTLTPDEQREGFALLFDGRTFRHWQDPAKKNQPGDAWAVSDGALKTVLKPRIEEDLLTEREYADYELRFDWRVSQGGNTGLKYRLQQMIFVDQTKVQKGPGGFEGLLGREISSPRSNRVALAPEARGFVYTVGFEYQLIDDERHPDAKRGPDRRTGALYSMIPPIEGHAKPAGEWNSSRLIVQGDHVEHWLNGVKVLDASLKDDRVIAGVNKRWKDVPSIREALTKPRPRGWIALQHHGDEVWFRNIRIREIR
jgi:hypothetical protein